ncbi:MAG: hypothetical protein U0183_11030 [Polyangiaceae bacterium]
MNERSEGDVRAAVREQYGAGGKGKGGRVPQPGMPWAKLWRELGARLR